MVKSYPRLTASHAATLLSRGYEVPYDEPALHCANNSCVYAAKRTGGGDVVLKLQWRLDQEYRACGSDCTQCRPWSDQDKELANTNPPGGSFILRSLDAFIVAPPRCEMQVTVMPRAAGRLMDVSWRWYKGCLRKVLNKTSGKLHQPHFLDVRCAWHQLLLAFEQLQRLRAPLVHNDMSWGQILVREPLPSVSCDANQTYRPHVLLSDFHLSFFWPRIQTAAFGADRPPEAMAELMFSKLADCDPAHHGCSSMRIARLNKSKQYPTPWSFDAWALAASVADMAACAPLLPHYRDLVEDCAGTKVDGTSSDHVTDHRLHRCAQRRYKVAEKELRAALQGTTDNFRRWLAQRSQWSGNVFWAGACSSLTDDVEGAALLQQLAAWDPHQRVTPSRALRSRFFDELSPACPSYRYRHI